MKSVVSVVFLVACVVLVGLLSGCIPDPDVVSGEPCAVEMPPQVDSLHGTMRGALLASRFSSLADLQTVISISYVPAEGEGPVESADSAVRVSHCSAGRRVVGVLSPGVSEGDFSAAQREGLGKKISVGTRGPFAVVSRKQLEQVFTLSRRRQKFLGEGDPAFYDLAAAMVSNIITPELAILTPRDTSDKGYLNTFNHMLAQALMTSIYSEELADFIADVHERQNMYELISGQFTPEQLSDPEVNPMDNYVDIINNEWGQELGKSLRKKYHITADTEWNPVLMANYLNDLQAYFSWAFQMGMEPFRPEDLLVRRFANKINFVKTFFPE